MSRNLEDALRDGASAYADGAVERALASADEALRIDAENAEALELRAQCLADLGQWEAADDIFASLLANAPTDAVLLLAAADVKIRLPGDDPLRCGEGLQLLERARVDPRREPQLAAEIALLRGIAHNQLGEPALAIAALERALALDSDLLEAQLEAGVAQFELGRFEAAERSFRGLTADAPDEPWAHHYLGLLAERRGADAEPFFRRARRLAPDAFPEPLHLTGPEFDRAVADAIAALPAHAKPHLDNVVIASAALPSDDDIREGLSPGALGAFEGTPIDERRGHHDADHRTARITLFQKNLERFAADRAALLEEVRITVLHEVGHLLGLDEEELFERGLD